MGRTTIRRGAGKRRVDGKSLRLADEIRYIQRRAADHDGRVVYERRWREGARNGDPEPIHIEENDTTFAIGWQGRRRIEGPAFIYVDHDTQLSTILGYPTHQLK